MGNREQENNYTLIHIQRCNNCLLLSVVRFLLLALLTFVYIDLVAGAIVVNKKRYRIDKEYYLCVYICRVEASRLASFEIE